MFKLNRKKVETKEKNRKFGKNLDFASIEAYNLLRTNLYFSLADVVGGKVVGVTSPCPQEGKSTTSLNLAYALAAAGHKVVLIDADMRRPSLADVLDMPISPGLSNLLVDENADAIHASVVHENLSVLLSGDIPPNPSELVVSDKMKALIEKLREAYDYVVVDLPPVNLVSDPIMMSRHLDGMIVIVRHGYTRRRDVNDAVRSLKLVNAKILGFVYNGAKTAKKRYRKSSYYRYSYYTSNKS
ncbi:MAG: CpsD/CapB family tyrosine-protein kinase [Clostridia bacterium]|nr:CpsD/CapB family tyrosine-protein kinase [Clostridia bacterium]